MTTPAKSLPFALALLAAGCGAPPPKAPPPPVSMLAPSPDAAKANTSATERYEAAQLVLRQAAEAHENGVQMSERAAEVDTRALWSRRLAEAAVDAGAMSAHDAFTRHLERMEALMQATKERFAAGQGSAIDVALVRFHVAEAKSLLEHAK